MHRSAAFLAIAISLLASHAPAADPCAPRILRDRHVPAFAAPPSRSADPQQGPAQVAPGGRPELEVQADCLAWEASVSRRAEIIGTVPLEAPGALPQSPEGGVFLVPVDPAGGLLPSSRASAPPSLFDAPIGPRSFTLGVTLLPAP